MSGFLSKDTQVPGVPITEHPLAAKRKRALRGLPRVVAKIVTLEPAGITEASPWVPVDKCPAGLKEPGSNPSWVGAQEAGDVLSHPATRASWFVSNCRPSRPGRFKYCPVERKREASWAGRPGKQVGGEGCAFSIVSSLPIPPGHVVQLHKEWEANGRTLKLLPSLFRSTCKGHLD